MRMITILTVVSHLTLQPFTSMERALESAMAEMSRIRPHEFHPKLGLTQYFSGDGGHLDFLRRAYEVGKDGKVIVHISFFLSVLQSPNLLIISGLFLFMFS